jgi:hypothetical protein
MYLKLDELLRYAKGGYHLVYIKPQRDNKVKGKTAPENNSKGCDVIHLNQW